MAIVLKTYCHVCGAAFEFTTNRRPKWLKKGCGRDHATTPWTRRQPAASPSPAHAKPTRQSATSSPGEAMQPAQPISGQHDADREAKPSRDPAERPET